MIEIKVNKGRVNGKGGKFSDIREMMLDLFDCHKALYRIIKSTTEKIGDEQEKVMIGAFIAFLIEFDLVEKMNKQLQQYINGEMGK